MEKKIETAIILGIFRETTTLYRGYVSSYKNLESEEASIRVVCCHVALALSPKP